jgi:tRNA(fMet)-specific endonuclease VapC
MLDTDACIYTIKRKPLQVLHRLETMALGSLSMSAITFAELMNGAKKSLQVEANLKRLHELSKIVAVFPFDEEAAEIYGDVRSELEKEGKPIGANDMLIAAHALSLDLILVTNNDREFGRVRGLKIENWVKERGYSTDSGEIT